VAEPAAAAAVAFAGGGAALLAAVGASVRVFDVARPGRDVACLSTRKTKRGDDDGAGLAGRLACVAAPADAAAAAGAADPHLAAAGSTRGAVLLFDYRVPSPVAVLDGGHAGGVTSVAFGPGSGGARVWSAARKDASLLCWDARALAGPLVTAARDAATTNQRLGIGFDPPGGTVVSGGTGGRVSAFDAATGARVARWTAAGGGAAVAGVACHPWLPLVATGSGERVWGEGESSGGEEAGADARAADDDCALPAVCVAVWRPPYRWTDADEWRE
jgi:WD40 repeat protein